MRRRVQRSGCPSTEENCLVRPAGGASRGDGWGGARDQSWRAYGVPCGGFGGWNVAGAPTPGTRVLPLRCACRRRIWGEAECTRTGEMVGLAVVELVQEEQPEMRVRELRARIRTQVTGGRGGGSVTWSAGPAHPPLWVRAVAVRSGRWNASSVGTRHTRCGAVRAAPTSCESSVPQLAALPTARYRNSLLSAWHAWSACPRDLCL